MLLVLCFILGACTQMKQEVAPLQEGATDGYAVIWFTTELHDALPQPVFEGQNCHVYVFQHTSSFSYGYAGATWGWSNLEYTTQDGVVAFFNYASPAIGWRAASFEYEDDRIHLLEIEDVLQQYQACGMPQDLFD